MIITHEVGQLDFGGVEKVIRNIIKYDKENVHQILAYKDGAYREELEKVGAKIIFTPKLGEDLEFDTDVLHVHSGGVVSELATNMGRTFPVIETIHSPIRSPMKQELIAQRVGVTDAVSKMNNNCLTIHNGIDFADLEIKKPADKIKEDLGIAAGVPVIGRVGRIAPDKCMEEWILTCYKLQQSGLDFVPLIVGGEARGLNGYVGKLKLLCESLPLRGVVWAGEQLNVSDYLNIMDVFLYPSPTEGFGLVFIEAMYNDTVVVSFRNQITTEVLGGYSILTEESIPALVEGVRLALDQNIKESMIYSAKNWVMSKFSAERMSKDYQDIYKKAVINVYEHNKSKTIEFICS